MAAVDRRDQAALNLAPHSRYQFLVDVAADRGEVWLLASQDGWVSCNLAARSALPIWPTESLALVVGEALWPGCEPRSLTVESFAELAEFTAQAGGCFLVFPDESLEGSAVEVDQLLASLEAGLSEQ